MKVCPSCKTENDDKYLFCVSCKRTLPRVTHLEKLMGDGLLFYSKGDYRKSLECFDELLKLNVGNKSAWLMKGLSLMKMMLMREAYNCIESSGAVYNTRRCDSCMGLKRCTDCGGTGTCNMCGGKRKCMLCGGSGECSKCGGSEPDCPMCKGTNKCVRCKGSGECSYCNGIGVCGKCRGNGHCGSCGGIGRVIKIDPNSIPRELRKYVI